jgi:hypothetical protein
MSGWKHCGCGQAACACCAGIETVTPRPTANRPGLDSIAYRIGTHAGFLQSMLARLALHRLADTGPGTDRPLSALAVRDPGDAAVALLDAWATVSDVLTFYQERIANEGYLRTATEMRSLHEMARLVGYRPRPGVAASVYLAYTIDANTTEQVVIGKGARSQSVPGPGELPQSFETDEDLAARSAWNLLKPRTTEPQRLDKVKPAGRLYLRGVTTNLKAGEPLLLAEGGRHALVRITELVTEPAHERSLVRFKAWADGIDAAAPVAVPAPAVAAPASTVVASLVTALTQRPSKPLPNALQLARRIEFRSTGDTSLQLTSALAPSLRDSIGAALAGIDTDPPGTPALEVFAFRVRSGVFGRNAPKRQALVRSNDDQHFDTSFTMPIGEWPIVETKVESEGPAKVDLEIAKVAAVKERTRVVHLESSHEGILPDSWVILDASSVSVVDEKLAMVRPIGEKARDRIVVTKATTVHNKVARAEYGVTGDTTRLGLEKPWIRFVGLRLEKGEPVIGTAVELNLDQAMTDRDFQVVRATTVFAQSERLELAEEPIETELCGTAHGSSDPLPVELDGIYQDLQPGRFVVVEGERHGLGDTAVVRSTEPLMITKVVHDVRAADQLMPWSDAIDVQGNRPPKLPGDRIHTFIWFDRPPRYCYRRDTVTILGNVVKATHGEARNETLGGGDGSKPLQSFELKQAPLTYLAAPTAVGARSSLQVFVNDVRWHEQTSFVDRLPTDRIFVTKADEAGKATVIFGNGREGARLPTGPENIKAVYRNGIGKAGNARARQISQLSTRPLGVKEVVNPLRASGGADPENRDQVRRNAPNAVMALDRLVSTRDYADFARSFAGIAKAAAVELSDGRRHLVHVTIAGADDIPIDPDSDLFINLGHALRDLGDPFQPLELVSRELLILLVSAGIRIHPDHRWETVVTAVRTRLLEGLGFGRRDLGQDVTASEVLALMQAVPGVLYVDLDLLATLHSMVDDPLAQDGHRPATPEEIEAELASVLASSAGRPAAPRLRVEPARREAAALLPAQLAMLLPDVPATLVLNQIQ